MHSVCMSESRTAYSVHLCPAVHFASFHAQVPCFNTLTCLEWLTFLMLGFQTNIAN